MPSQTFFNLPNEKKQGLLAAAKKEFSRAPLYEASIANIIHEADIPRGSFYQYFADKEDLYFYLLQIDADSRKQKITQNIRSHDGNFFTALIDILQDLLDEIENEEAQNFYRNVFLNLNFKTEKTFIDRKIDTEFNNHFDEIKSLVDIGMLNVENEEELFQVVQISITVMMQNIVWKFAKELSNEAVIETFTKQLELLKKGFLKGD